MLFTDAMSLTTLGWFLVAWAVAMTWVSLILLIVSVKLCRKIASIDFDYIENLTNRCDDLIEDLLIMVQSSTKYVKKTSFRKDDEVCRRN